MSRVVGIVLAAALPAVPLFLGPGTGQYVLHVLIQIFIWSFVGQAWSLMGRFGLGVARARSVPRDGGVHRRPPVELLPADPVGGRADRRGPDGAVRRGGRVPVLPVPGRGPLLPGW